MTPNVAIKEKLIAQMAVSRSGFRVLERNPRPNRLRIIMPDGTSSAGELVIAVAQILGAASDHRPVFVYYGDFSRVDPVVMKQIAMIPSAFKDGSRPLIIHC